MSSSPLANFYQTLLSIARVESKYCQTAVELRAARQEIRRFERRLALLRERATVPRSGGKRDGASRDTD